MGENEIDRLQDIALTLVQVGIKIEEATDADSPKGEKIALTEGVALLVFLVPKAISYAGDGALIKEQFKNATSEDWQTIVDFISGKLDLQNDEVENLIEVGLVWVMATNNLRLAVRDILKKEE